MIRARPGLVARYPNDVRLPIEAWSDDGKALIADLATGQLVPANERPGYEGLEYAAMALIPGGGWRVRWPDRPPFSNPVVAWALLSDGSVVPLDSDNSGHVHDARSGDLIYHPDTRDPENDGS